MQKTAYMLPVTFACLNLRVYKLHSAGLAFLPSRELLSSQKKVLWPPPSVLSKRL